MTYRESGPANDTILDEGWARGEIEKAITPEGALYPDAAEVRRETEERLQDLSEEELAELSHRECDHTDCCGNCRHIHVPLTPRKWSYGPTLP